ncbi:unnamed protein product [Rotaria socialis]|uniref:Fatty acid synthase n=1 Tax=Rotaria socialis TaxID=392032 RepID=A0A818SGM1_9BILA|nr:unnamed protein product [Rotaria socialis]
MSTKNILDSWEIEINEVGERCDFNGLLKHEKKNKVLLNQYDHILQPKSITRMVDGGVYQKLERTCYKNGLTLNSVLQFVWHKILSIYGNSSQTVIGTNMFGVTLLPSIMYHNVDDLIVDAIKNIQDKMNDVINRSNLDLFQPSKGKTRYSLFDSLLICESLSDTVAKLEHPLTIVAYEKLDNECLIFVLNYAGELFEDDAMDDLLAVTNELLTQIANNQVTLVNELNFLPMKQLNKINEWNNTDKEFPFNNKQTTLHQLFETEVEKSPDKIAVIYEDGQLTYKELNEKANQLAHYIRSICDMQPDDLIALFLDKSELMIVSILGVWKSGAAYVPIDPSYPDERIQFILEDTKAKIILANKKYITKLGPYELIKIEIESLSTIIIDNEYSKNLGPVCLSNNLAYVTYTSGTTGKPKGVMKEHKSVINVVIDLTDKYNLSVREQNPERIVLFSQYVFEPFIRQFLMALLNLHVLVIIKQDEIHHANRFNLSANEYRISYLNGTASLLQGYDYTNLKSLKRLIFAGEELTENCFTKLRKTFQEIIIDEYGPTESALVSTMKMYGLCDKRNNRSIGKPLINVKCYVLDKSLTQLPIGATGELYIGGIGVARGYLNRPELTAERFLPNPFQTNQEKKEGRNARIYKTGDLVRWLPNGELEYLGRNDFQVKIRGLRIELGEIEAVLSSYQGVNRSVVLAKDHKKKNTDTPSTKYLVGYYVSDNDIDESHIKQYIQTKLPDYMIPNRLMRIDKIPVTINGKLDAKALPDIDFSADENNYCAPRNKLEANLCVIWSDILGIEKVGITDDFFRLGGDSIGSLQIVGRVRQHHDLNISVKDIFMFKTIEKLYDNKLKDQLIHSNGDVKSLNGIELTNSTGEIGLLCIQEYFLKRKDLPPNHFNQHVVFRIARFDEAKFKDCLAQLVEHHEAFRMRFKKDAHGKYSPCCRTNLDSEEINLVQMKNSSSNELNFQTELNDLFIKTVDIENGPMYMVGYSYDPEDNGSTKVWILIHDLIVDLTSCRIIIEDLQRLYHGSSFSSSSCYKQWSIAVKEYVTKLETSEVAYWESFLNANVKNFNRVLTDKQQTNNDISETETILPEQTVRSLLNDCNKIYNTQIEHLLLTALGCTLRDEITSLKKNYAMFECSGREFVNNLDLNRSIGMFRTLYPVRLQLADDDDVRSSIINVKEHMKQVPNKGIGFGAIMGNESNELPLVSFNYLGSFENEHNENGNEDGWSLLDAFRGNSLGDNANEVVKINSVIINKQMRLNIKTKMGIEETVQFGKAFQINIEKIIKHTQSLDRSYLTSSDVHYVIKNNDYLNRIQLEKEVEAIFMANSLQQGFLFHSLKQGNVDDAYIVQSVFQYGSNIDQNCFRIVWEHAQQRFSSLRLRFDWQEELVQIVDKKQSLDWRFIDLTAEEGDVSNQESKIKKIQEEDRNDRFKLDIGNLFRVYLIQQKTDLFALIFSFHHIILDGWSIPILFDYVHHVYLNLIEGKHQLFSLPSSFRDESYEHAQMYLQKHRLDNIDYWENEINKIEERCDFNGLLKEENKNKVVLNQYDHVKEPKSRTLIIGDNLYRNLKAACRESGLTWNSILQFVWHKVLSVYGNSSQTVIGTTVSGRNLPVNDIETSVGLFINTLPLIVNHCVDGLIIDAIKYIQDKMNEMIARSNVDFSQLSKGTSKHSLFDCLFVYENYPTLEDKAERTQRLLHCETKYSIEKLDYPLAVVAYETVANHCVIFEVKYAGELFDEETIADLLDVANQLCMQIGNGQVTQVSDLNFLPTKQLKMINEWNSTCINFAELNTQTTLHKLFEEEAEKSSDKIAVVYEDVQLTYRELNVKANQLAHYLRSSGNIRPDDLICLLLDKSELMIISILGVWKSGAAYVPIDSSYPDERIQFILQDTKAKIIIANKRHIQRLHSYDGIRIDIDSFYSTSVDGSWFENPHDIASSNSLAYVIYTSGTTGKPKGVMIEHSGVINLKTALTDLLQLRSRVESILSFSNYVFDHFVEQMSYALLNSHVLVILDDEMRVDRVRFNQYMNKCRVTYLSGTPSVLVNYDFETMTHLIRIAFGGEDLTEVAFDKVRSGFIGLIHNGYGPTEVTITSHEKLYYLHEKRMNKSIGRQIANVSSYVLDSNFRQLPIGAIGELYIGGIGVARGYLNRPELTAERFLPNPFQTDKEKKEGKNTRIYKTGDLARWLPNGELEYLGRNDLQVKIRGFRIELSEIETILSSYKGIKRSVVLARDHRKKGTDASSTKYLVGYYISDNDINENDVKRFMGTKLPDYMIPNRLMRIAKIPVTINGKLDIKALPDIEFSRDDNNYCAPRNSLEVKLCEIWSDVLGTEKVGITDDFFRLGGDSLSVLQLVGRIARDLNLSVSVKDMLSLRTIERISHYVILKMSDEYVREVSMPDPCQQVVGSGWFPLLPIQEWFFMKYSAGMRHWNQAFLIETPILDQDRLKDSLIKLMDYHDAFKLRFKRAGDAKYFQYYDDSVNVPDILRFNHLDVSSLGQSENSEILLHGILTKWQSQFDVQNGPLFAVGYLNGFSQDKVQVWFAMHHLIVDTVSWRIICDDLRRLYDDSSNLGKKGSSYGEWSRCVQSYGTRKSMTEGVYWRNLVRNVCYFNDNLSKNSGTSANRLATNATSITLNKIQTCSLLRDCPHAYGSNINGLLLTALGYALKELTGDRINYVTLEGHGREDIGDDNMDISRTVGWFTTMYPVLLEIDDDLMRSIMNIKAHLIQVPNKGIGYGTIIGYKDQDLPRVSFNYLGQFEAASSTRASNSGKDRRWYLTDGIVGDERAETAFGDDVVAVNGLCMKGQIRFNITSRLTSDRTTQLANSFKSKLEDIIRNCFSAKSPIEIDYSNDFEQPFVLLNADSDNILFILPPGDGGAESYFNNIVPHLSSYKLVIFNNYYYNLKEKNMEKGVSFEALARLYIKYIKLIQLNGPYNFLGWSFGGVLSFEIARQLNNAGDPVANILMIDSYFNMSKAYLEIGKMNSVDEVNQINYLYLPQIDNEAFALNIANMNIKIVLFKANLAKEGYLLNDQLELFKYYINTTFNCLDTLVNHKYIQLFQMYDDSHFSWVSNKEQIANICNHLESILQ